MCKPSLGPLQGDTEMLHCPSPEKTDVPICPDLLRLRMSSCCNETQLPRASLNPSRNTLELANSGEEYSKLKEAWKS